MPDRDRTLYMYLTAPVDVIVDWGDGSPPERIKDRYPGNSVSLSHGYRFGEYQISIAGYCREIYYSPNVTEVLSFGGLGARMIAFDYNEYLTKVPEVLPNSIRSLDRTFYNCINFNDSSVSNWNTENVLYFGSTFENAENFNQPLLWNTSKGIVFTRMLRRAYQFNQPLDTFDFSNALYAERFLEDSSSFNQPMLNLNLPKVDTLERFFSNCYAFNGPLGIWNTPMVSEWTRFLDGCHEFNQPIEGLDLSDARDLSYFLNECYVFNQPVEALETGRAEYFNNFLADAYAFNQPLANLKVGSAENMDEMLYNTSSLSQDISNWLIPYISEEPFNFNDNGILTPEQLPVWNAGGGGTEPVDFEVPNFVVPNFDYTSDGGTDLERGALSLNLLDNSSGLYQPLVSNIIYTHSLYNIPANDYSVSDVSSKTGFQVGEWYTDDILVFIYSIARNGVELISQRIEQVGYYGYPVVLYYNPDGPDLDSELFSITLQVMVKRGEVEKELFSGFYSNEGIVDRYNEPFVYKILTP